MLALAALFLREPATAATGTLADVKHVVIMMQENRSFDHYFGTMSGVRGYGDRATLSFQNGNSACHQPLEAGYVLPFHTSEQLLHDVPHDWNALHGTWNSGKWDTWVSVNGTTAMAYHRREDVPLYHALAEAYTICDASFCSVLGPTIPNRLYFCSGKIGFNAEGNGIVTTGSIPPEGFNWTTYPERLQAAGVSWRFYRPIGDWIGGTLAFFAQYTNAGTASPLYQRGVAMVPDVVAAFRQDVTNGTLPRVSWVLTPLELTEHPPWSPANGQRYVKQVLDVIASVPEVYDSTVFILTYDENGGFFDHIPPPVPPPGTPDEFTLGVPIGLGARVPTILISPWSRGGYVCSQVFDLTSVIRFLEQWTGVVEPNISAWRRQVCGDLTSAFDFANPDFSRPILPDLAPVDGWPVTPAVPSEQRLPVQESGTRRSRPLPYQPNASSHADCSSGTFTIVMANSGAASVHFSVYANAYRTDGPWQYDVRSGGSAIANFVIDPAADGYDLTCYGPNGFLRRFAGIARGDCSGLEISSRIDPVGGNLTLALQNTASQPATFTVTDHHSFGGPWNFIVPAQGQVEHTFDPEIIREGWYDLTVRANVDSSFVRRLAGHIETGKVTKAGLAAYPALAATIIENQFQLKYPGALSGRTLESSTHPKADSWTPVGVLPSKDSNSNNVVKLPLGTEPAYFRLRP